MQTKIIHLTSAHPRYDIRIFVKMCSSLAKLQDYEVRLVVADGQGNEMKNGVEIIDVGERSGGRLSRMTKTVQKVYQKALELNSDIYHLHDPELIPIGLKLKQRGKKVIFDAHEDLPKQLMGKPYLNKPLRWVLSKPFALFEKLVCGRFDAIVTATPSIRDKFLKMNANVIDINNFPILGELADDTPWEQRKNEVCYVGGIAGIRVIRELVKAMSEVDDVWLNLVGAFSDKALEAEVAACPGWARVNVLGYLDRQGVAKVMGTSKAGLVLFHALPNHVDAQPNKMFEYMSAGLPLIVSDFPLWREIVDGSECGLCVDSLDIDGIAEAVNYIVSNPLDAERMGNNGKKAVSEQYNWGVKERKLYKLYEDLSA